MSAYFEDLTYSGMGHWLREQAREEMMHALKFYNYLKSRGGRIVFDAQEKPTETWKSPLDAFKDAYNHEVYISKNIHKLLEQAEAAKDHPTVSFPAMVRRRAGRGGRLGAVDRRYAQEDRRPLDGHDYARSRAGLPREQVGTHADRIQRGRGFRDRRDAGAKRRGVLSHGVGEGDRPGQQGPAGQPRQLGGVPTRRSSRGCAAPWPSPAGSRTTTRPARRRST